MPFQDGSEETENDMQNLPKKMSIEGEGEGIFLPGPSIFHLNKLLPNAITALSTVCGMTATRFMIIDGNPQMAVLCILLAGVLDGLDGPVARALKGTSKFGAEFDSLADFVNFGVSPALVLYYWGLTQYGLPGWVFSMCFMLAVGCRLARFNAGVDFNAAMNTRNYFMGVPAPAAGLIVLFPVVLSFELGPSGFYTSFPFLAFHCLFSSFLAVSRLPTFSSKAISLRATSMILSSFLGKFLSLIAILSASYLLVMWYHNPWRYLLLIALIYFVSFPISLTMFASATKKSNKATNKIY